MASGNNWFVMPTAYITLPNTTVRQLPLVHDAARPTTAAGLPAASVPPVSSAAKSKTEAKVLRRNDLSQDGHTTLA